jgi:hypothetical protein
MSGEGLSADNKLIDIERQELELIPLIDHTLEWMEIDSEIDDSSNCNNLLWAMIEVRYKYREVMPPITKQHLRRMLVLYSCLVGVPSANQDDMLTSSLRSTLSKEFAEFESFDEDLSNMPETWQAAMGDITKLLGDMEAADE